MTVKLCLINLCLNKLSKIVISSRLWLPLLAKLSEDNDSLFLSMEHIHMITKVELVHGLNRRLLTLPQHHLVYAQ